MNIAKYEKSKHKSQVELLYKEATALRNDKDMPEDTSLQELFEVKNEGLKFDDLLEDLGIDLQTDTIQNVITQVDDSVKWLVPEIVRSQIRLGMNRSPIYPNIIRSEEPISALKVQQPFINQSDAAPRFVGEGETIQFGTVSYGSKEFKIRKMGRGIKITDEARQYSTLKIMNIFFEDFGVRLGYGLDSLAVDILLNGEQDNGSASAPVIGVENTTTGLTYRDLLKVWIRMGKMGKSVGTMVGGENMALEILDLDEFKVKTQGTVENTLNVKTPIPSNSDFFIHGNIDADQVVILDTNTTMVKYNARPLMIESERIVSNQTEASYASLTTGFATLFRDSRIVLDSSVPFSTNGFPEYMNPDALAIENIK